MQEHIYKITCDYVRDAAGNTPQITPLSFETTLHEDIFVIVEKLQEKNIIPTEDAAAFGLGLKLFAEVIRRHENTQLCANLRPHLIEIMKKVKKA